jgi:tetratricopeptide (TPR) repeat protein
MRHSGWTFLSLSILALAITAHTGWIHYYESAGARAYAQIRIPDELALARNDPARWLSSSEKQIIADGSRQYNVAFKYGLFTNVDALPKLAWLEYLSGNADRSAALLERSAAAQSGPSRALSLYYRGAILNRLGKYRDALSSLDLAINESPDLAAAREERGEALWQMGKRDEAVAEWISLTAEHDALIAQYMLAGSSQVLGDDAGSMRYLEKARSATPDDALFNWTIGMRLQNLGMKKLAENSFQRAVEIDPAFRRALEFDLINGR